MFQARRMKKKHHREIESDGEDDEEFDERKLYFLPSNGINIEVLVFYLRSYLGNDADVEIGAHCYFIRSRLGLSSVGDHELGPSIACF
jgi:hypothetical protein